MAKKPPKYCLHKASGQAFVYINRRPEYLGEYDPPQSRRRYHEVVANWCNSSDLKNADLTISELVDVYFSEHVAAHYRKNDKPTSEVSAIASATRILVRLCGDLPAIDFSPKKLKADRNAMIEAEWKRTSINKQVGRIRRLFAWAVAEELVTADILVGLQTVTPLQRGRTAAIESRPVLPVPESHIHAVRDLATAPVKAMIDLQLLTGARR